MSINFGTSRRRNEAGLFGNILGIILGVGAALGMQFTILQTAQETETWPSVQGIVLESDIESTTNSDGDRMYEAHVLYKYEVRGETYTSDQISLLDGSTGSRRPIRNIVREYPVESAVEVFYHPEDPADSLLRVGATTLLKWFYRGAWIIAALCLSDVFRKLFRLLRRIVR